MAVLLRLRPYDEVIKEIEDLFPFLGALPPVTAGDPIDPESYLAALKEFFGRVGMTSESGQRALAVMLLEEESRNAWQNYFVGVWRSEHPTEEMIAL